MLELFFSLAIFLAYIGFIWVTYGIQPSISESYYDLPGKQKYIFTLVIWAFAIPVMIVGDNIWFFLAGSLICFVGAAPAFRDEDEGNMRMIWNAPKNKLEPMPDRSTEYWIHMIGAYGGTILGIAGLLIGYHQYATVLVALLAAVIIYWKASNKIWWLEILAFTTIWEGILIELLLNR